MNLLKRMFGIEKRERLAAMMQEAQEYDKKVDLARKLAEQAHAALKDAANENKVYNLLGGQPDECIGRPVAYKDRNTRIPTEFTVGVTIPKYSSKERKYLMDEGCPFYAVIDASKNQIRVSKSVFFRGYNTDISSLSSFDSVLSDLVTKTKELRVYAK